MCIEHARCPGPSLECVLADFTQHSVESSLKLKDIMSEQINVFPFPSYDVFSLMVPIVDLM